MSKAREIVDGLGGADNIDEIEGCITRLRCTVVDPGRVNTGALAELSYGARVTGHAVQVVVGPSAESLAERIQDLL
ncbi:PTS glucose/sucrose transporter subunit IIB [Tsukamurella serpentis]